MLAKTGANFEGGGGESALLSSIQVEGRIGGGCVPNTKPSFRNIVHKSFFILACVGWIIGSVGGDY